MRDTAYSQSRIVKNTLFLYLRMFITMGVSLYTSRIILELLGIENYGLYNVIGGIVVLLSIVCNSMTAATQRFITYELGTNNIEQVNKTFSMSIIAHLAICVIVVILGETVGLWYINNKLNIPEGREEAAVSVFQLSLITTCVSLLRAPYNASVVAYEKMSVFAYMSILEVFLKLALVCTLAFCHSDRLILYSLFSLLLSIIMYLTYRMFCRAKFKTCNFRFFIDFGYFKKLFGYLGWNLLGAGASLGTQQAGNLIINRFLGVAVNAAYGVSSQVNNAINMFVSNFQIAFTPQLVKLFSQDNMEDFWKLSKTSALLSYYLVFVISFPIFFNIDYVLGLWLVEVPQYAGVFCQLLIIYSLIDAVQAPLWIGINATGNIKIYEIWLSSILILNIPLSIILLKMGWAPYWVLLVRVILNFISAIVRCIHVKFQFGFPILQYFHQVIIKVLLVTLSTVIPCRFIMEYINVTSFGKFCLFCVISILAILLAIYSFGINNDDRIALKTIMNNKINVNNLRRIFYGGICKLPLLSKNDRLQIKRKWYERMPYTLHLSSPKTYNEKLQWMKLYDHNPLYTRLVDKYSAKKYVADIIGEDYIIPTLGIWRSFDDIPFDQLPDMFVLKCTHDSGSTIICKNKYSFNLKDAREKLEKGLKRDYYSLGQEWPYKDVPHRIIAERYIEDSDELELRDYKFFCFNGKVKWMYVVTNRQTSGGPYLDFYDMHFNHLPISHCYPNSPFIIKRPKCFEEMIRIASKLSQGLPQVRVDLYEVKGKIYFGEFTFFSSAGWLPFEPEEWDYTFGQNFVLP